MVIRIVTEIILKNVNDDLFNNIIAKDNLEVMWEKLKTIYFQVRPTIVYSILKELLIYPKINKPKEFEKHITWIFIEVKFLIKQLRNVVTSNKDI